MKTILVNLESSAALDATLACAIGVAREFGSYLEGLHVRPVQPDVIAAGADGFIAAAPDLVAGFETDARERAERLRDTFERTVRAAGLPRFSEPGTTGPAADWHLGAGAAANVLGSYGRIFDLIVLGRPVADSLTPSTASLEGALFEAGRLLMIVPARATNFRMERILISWNGSTETAHTIGLAMPFLERAKSIIVHSVEKGMVPGPSGEALGRMLERRGLTVEVVDHPGDDRPVGKVTLDEAQRLGADIIVKGAYTQSRLRQMIFGGATSYILSNVEVPVLMAH
ncbi:MAG TPA: universal stress protein [Geminicoccus sp.]|jgi:nucleotide-binding universal stress UspA family protein|uniref:universal stress protein n=1 Tax=Geminicoccus sp. TaxID=2024832 RepID=UPI002E375EF1|nr:universal stress protein [Geminicoccus sp.]HEX2525663.1 universal stress protein [Geminicoccus sp.]